MRTDAKLGLVIALVVVLVGGGYFLFGNRGDAPIDLAGTAGKDSAAAKDATPSTKPAAPQPKRTPERVAGGAPSGTTAAKPNPAAKPPVGESTVMAPLPSVVNRPSSTPGTSATPPVGEVNKPATGTPAASAIERKAAEDARVAGAQPATPPAGGAGKPEAGPTTTPPATTPSTGTSGDTVSGQGSPTGTTGAQPGVRPAVREAEKPLYETHRVQQGETFAGLAKSYYGDQQLAEYLVAVNPQLGSFGKLTAGMVVNIPPSPTQAELAKVLKESREKVATTGTKEPAGGSAKEPAAAAVKEPVKEASKSVPAPAVTEKATSTGDSKRTYVVKSGDTFYGIAKDQLGASSRWKELYELNKAVVKGDPKSLKPGQVIVLPAAATKAGA